MFSLRTSALGLAVLVGAVLGSHLYANPGSSPPAETTGDQSVAEDTLSPQQMQSQAEELKARIASRVAQGRQMLSAARREKDQLRFGCVNQSQFVNERLLEVSSDAVLSLGTAVRTGNRSQQVANYKRVAQAAAQCDEAVTGIGSCASSKDVKVTVDTDKVIVKKPKIIDDPTDDCNNLGLGNCANQPLEYVAFSSPFIPD